MRVRIPRGARVVSSPACHPRTSTSPPTLYLFMTYVTLSVRIRATVVPAAAGYPRRRAL